ncbi:MAG: lipopolysaccharide heptosyltransferase II [Acidobacteriota bacterium]|nr:lipopolysaccharide heptosyltransferase II [Acidobacteriota bacterium]
MKTLVILPNWVGDTVMAQPVLASLAASGREIHGLARTNLIPLLRLIPQLASSMSRGASNRETIEKIKQLGPDEVVILPNSFRAAWLAQRAGIPRRWGYSGDFRHPLLRPAVAKPRQPKKRKSSHDNRLPSQYHQLNDYDPLLTAMRIDPVGDNTPRLEPGKENRLAARQALAASGLAQHGDLVGLFAGTAFGPSKRWPPDRFAELARRLAATDKGPDPVLIVGPGETELARSIADASGLDLPILGAGLDLAVLAAVLERLSLLVTNDSGPMHLAAAVGTRCVAIFGPTDPRRTAPLGDVSNVGDVGDVGESATVGAGHEVLWTSRWCSPCFRRRCPLLHHKCLRDIRVEDVLRSSGYSNS